MYYEIYKDSELINSIVGEEAWVSSYCDRNGYTYIKKEMPIQEPEPEPEPTTEEILNAMLGVSE